MDVSSLLQIATPPTVSLILTKLGTRDLCASAQKNCGRDFRNFDFKIFGNFFKVLNFDFVSVTAKI